MEIKIIPEQDYTDTVFCYQPNFISKAEINKLKQWIDSMTDFKYSSNYLQTGYSRLQKWYQVDQKYFCNQWKNKPSTWESFQYEPILYELQTKIQQRVNEIIRNLYETNNLEIQIPKINSCLINKYRDGNDYIKPHRDTELSFGSEPTIIGLSIGCPRDILFKRVKYEEISKPLYKLDKLNQNLNFQQKLESGSLFIMGGSSQRFFSHEIPKSSDINSIDSSEMESRCRYSLTFREFIS